MDDCELIASRDQPPLIWWIREVKIQDMVCQGKKEFKGRCLSKPLERQAFLLTGIGCQNPFWSSSLSSKCASGGFYGNSMRYVS
jgi:hypothetical protein